MNNITENQRIPLIAVIGIAASIVMLVMVSYGIGMFAFVSAEQRGIFGDMYGALNTAFSGLAFIAIVSSQIQQRSALLDTRRDFDQALNLQMQALQLMKEEFEISNWQQQIAAAQSAKAVCRDKLTQLELNYDKNASEIIIIKRNIISIERRIEKLVLSILDAE